LELCFGGSAPSRNPSSISALPGGRFEARNQTIENLVRVAYGFEQVDPRHGVVDGGALPSARVTRFDVTAVSDREWTNPPAGRQVPTELRTLLRELLENRFKLKARLETKNVDVAALRLARSTPGPGLRRAASECAGPYADPPIDGSAPAPACLYHVDSRRVEAGAMTMAEVAKFLQSVPGLTLRAAIVDQTGLAGRYDVALDIGGPINARRRMPVDVESAAGARGTLLGSDLDMERRPIAVREALEKQLGLKLVNTKAEIPVLRIEHAENPEED